MRKLLIFTFVTLVFNEIALSQTVFVELGGPGLASINFDTRFGKKDDGFGGRVGIGGFSISDNLGDKAGVIFIPIGLNYLIGKDEKNYFEIGAGVTPVVGTGDLNNSDFGATFGHIILGYRMQPKIGGFTFRAFACPVFGNGVFIPYYGGLSFGYKFGKGKK